MHNLLNPENPGMRFLSRIFDLIVLNLAFLLTCIPILTIGPSLSALYKITILMVRGEDSYIIKGYFKAFAQNFKQAFLLWIAALLLLGFFGADLYIVLFVIGPAYKLLLIPIFIILFAILSVIIYAFPLISRYVCTIRQALKNAVLLSLANIPTTIYFVALPLAILYVAFQSAALLVFLFSILLFIGFALHAFVNSLFLNRIFDRCMQEDAGANSEAAEDAEKESTGITDEEIFSDTAPAASAAANTNATDSPDETAPEKETADADGKPEAACDK